MITAFTDEDFSRWVVYTDGFGVTKRGRLKDWNNDTGYAFVVFNCQYWPNFKHYKAAKVPMKHLHFMETKQPARQLPGQTELPL